VRPAVGNAMSFRAMLEGERGDLVKGLMLLEPGQRTQLRSALEAADWPGMSLITDVENAAEKVFHEVETKVEEFDGQALAEARALLAEAKIAESQVLALILTNRSQLIALVEEYGPEVVAAVEAILKDLLTQVQGLFGLTPPE
jgi:hypothetical protein